MASSYSKVGLIPIMFLILAAVAGVQCLKVRVCPEYCLEGLHVICPGRPWKPVCNCCVADPGPRCRIYNIHSDRVVKPCYYN
ncbi:hypothetical protein M569_09034 [Genlisea aurea]|uniref:Uncharacterized protein n=1 Tax=Genlisea aurea TaxID=192259 RepID=S8DRJ6_9LAMI|nr:hypothetical protein M569_09034 [Genlisea aurea]